MPNSLGLADWTIDGKTMDGTTHVVEATYNVRPEACPLCGVIGPMHVHNTRPMKVKDVPHHGEPAPRCGLGKRPSRKAYALHSSRC
jgi:hypothetical protein